MFKVITPLILIVVAVAIFFVFTSPLYSGISELKTQSSYYNEALDNSKALANERDKLTAKYNEISQDNLLKIQKFLPDNIDNIRLVLEIEQIALPYGMVLKNIKYNTELIGDGKTTTPPAGTNQIQGGGTVAPVVHSDYGTWDLEFSTTGSYDNFINFTKDLESNLRVVDIASIDFSSENGNEKNPLLASTYQYNFRIKTYWLKN